MGRQAEGWKRTSEAPRNRGTLWDIAKGKRERKPHPRECELSESTHFVL